MSQNKLRKDHRVIFRRPAQWHDVQWYEGIITRINYDRNGAVKSYAVQEFEPMCERRETHETLAPGKFYRVSAGQENIRILPYERCYTGRLHDAMNARPIVKDPYAHLYMGAGRFTMPSKEAIEGLIGFPLMSMVRIVSYRRRIMEGTIAPYNIAANPLEILHSILPKERDLDQLRKMAQKDSSVMLQLADVYRFELLGTEVDFEKANEFYKCAATGLNEQEYKSHETYKWKFAYPMGNPEALTAFAYDERKMFCNDDDEDDEDDEDESWIYEEGPDDFDSILSKQASSVEQEPLIEIEIENSSEKDHWQPFQDALQQCRRQRRHDSCAMGAIK